VATPLNASLERSEYDLSETTAALVQGSRAQRRSLKDRLVGLEARRGTGPLRADASTITAQVARLDDLLRRDVPRANRFFRTHIAPITCTPVKQNGRKFSSAPGESGQAIDSDRGF
jgi:hypothetical protein